MRQGVYCRDKALPCLYGGNHPSNATETADDGNARYNDANASLTVTTMDESVKNKFKNKYRISSARAAWWDYGWPGAYFVTICTARQRCDLGAILGQTMDLSRIGVLADVFWHEIPHHARQVELGAFVVMPNHVHGILILQNEHEGNAVTATGTVETRHALSLPPQPSQPSHDLVSPGAARLRNPGKNTLSSIVGGYKSAVSRHAHRLGFAFAWQSRFHDHMIRNDDEYQRINDYVEANHRLWAEDRFYIFPRCLRWRLGANALSAFFCRDKALPCL